jgi:splicing factor 1
VNTRLERTKQKLQAKRSNAITKLRILEPTYWPPACMNYKCPFLEERIDIPQDDFPEVGFPS